MTCKLMKRLMEVDDIQTLPYESIEQIKRIICGTHNGVCSERYSGIKGKLECNSKDLCKYLNGDKCSRCLRNLSVFSPKDYFEQEDV